VNSHDRYIDVDFAREMSYHIDCGLAEWARSNLAEQFKGRILSEEDHRVLEQVLKMAKARDQKVRVYDISRMTDRIRALKRAVFKTPTLIIDEQRYQGLEEISRAVLSKFRP
jgi:hypothetical protein